jgi:predicted Zn-dependent protease
MISRRLFTAGLAATMCGCVTHHQSGPATGLADTSPGTRPADDSDEAGLWMITDKQEQDLRRSPNRIRDKPINDLIKDIICRLGGAYCQDLRPYVIRVPAFNATCSPNGMIQVWSGLLLRCSTESQLAAVLGHEIGHYLKRHSLQRMRDNRQTDDFMAFLNLTFRGSTGAFGSVLERDLMEFSKSMFSRDHERESDAIGFKMMADAGYDPFACAEMWRRVKAEGEAAGDKERMDYFHDTHPPTSERIETLDALAQERGKPAHTPPDRLNGAIKSLRRSFMADEINQGRFKRTETLFRQLFADGNDPGGALFHHGEMYRRRNRDGDEAIALGFYHDACETADPPPEAFRGVGMIRWRRGETAQAQEYFRRYLNADPRAGDRDMIGKYLSGA